MPGAALGVVVLGAHGGGRHGSPGLVVQPEATVEFVADRQRIIERQGDKGRRDMAGHVFYDDADRLDLRLDC